LLEKYEAEVLKTMIIIAGYNKIIIVVDDEKIIISNLQKIVLFMWNLTLSYGICPLVSFKL
jgi:hypothetical protein